MSSGAAQGLYSPLPQSISDSDSEEELHSAIPIQSSRNNKDKGMMQNGLSKEYHHLEDAEEHVNGYPSVNDVPIVKDAYRKPMSGPRKSCFVASIVVCFMTIVVFLWVLPCSDDATCLAGTRAVKSSNWEKPYHDIELMGPINIIEGLPGHSRNLLFLYRGAVTIAGVGREANKSVPSGGAVSILGDSGAVAWYISGPRLPSDIDCSLIDVDKNGQMDCIMTGENGLLEAIDPLSGQVHWVVHIHSENNTNIEFTSIDFPLIISDVNSDGVNELITSCGVQKGNQNIIAVISGRMGNVIGKQVQSECLNVHGLQLSNNYLTFSCQHVNTSEVKEKFIPLRQFYMEVLDRTYFQSDIDKSHKKSFKVNDNQRNIYSLNGRQLIVSNQGHCPGSCSVSVQLYDDHWPQNLTWSYNGTNMYGMVPTTLSFKNSQSNMDSLQGHINGFILKFWQWKTEHAWAAPKKRSIPPKINTFNNNSFTEQLLTERLVLITFNKTNFNIVNASQNEIRQLCSYDRVNCQPDLTFQENSVLVADLDKDGSQELVSYLSTFVYDEDEEHRNEKYFLQSIVKVIRLESELPKLYESVTKY